MSKRARSADTLASFRCLWQREDTKETAETKTATSSQICSCFRKNSADKFTMQKSVLISGASRGTGLALASEFLSRNYRVFATCRKLEEATDLSGLLHEAGKKHMVLECDVSCDTSIEACKNKFLEFTDKLDVLINNAAISTTEDEPPSKLQRDQFLRIMNTNVAGCCCMTQAFLPCLMKSAQPKVINISSETGSITLAKNTGSISFRCSKTAIHMTTKCFALEFPDVTFVSVMPGCPPVTIEDSVEGIGHLVQSLAKSATGFCFNYQGEKIPY